MRHVCSRVCLWALWTRCVRALACKACGERACVRARVSDVFVRVFGHAYVRVHLHETDACDLHLVWYMISTWAIYMYICLEPINQS